MMDKQIRIFSVNTHAFYMEEEKELYNKLSNNRDKKKSYNEWLKLNYLDRNFPDSFETYNKKRDEYINSKNKKESEYCDYFKGIANVIKVSFKKQAKNKMTKEAWKTIHLNENIFNEKAFEECCLNNEDYKELCADIESDSNDLKFIIKTNKDIKRILNREVLYGKDKEGNEFPKLHKQISLFTSILTDILGIETDKLYEDIIVVKSKSADIMEQLVKNDFEFAGKTFIFMTSSAGQIRVKKGVFINKEVLEKYVDTLMCGLSKELINIAGGVNPNKYLAYLALNNTSCDIWENFDIDKAIVVPDFETEVANEYDYIDKETMKIIPKALKEKGKIKIIHSDGCGWILKSDINNNPFQFRAGWFKGLLVPVPYLDYCKIVNNYKVTDIDSKEWDLQENDIQYIFTKSQFKMYKYYKNDVSEDGTILKYGWDKYKENFKKYNCKAGKLNVAPDKFINKEINYQMLQTLTDMTGKEIDKLTKPTIDKIIKSYTDTKAMLNILGATDENPKITAEQQCLKAYPSLLRDYHFKESLESAIACTKKDAKGGTFTTIAKSTFIVPDVYAWMEYLIGKNPNPMGGLKAGQVYCKLYNNKKYPKLACLRSPHLYREWAIRDNVKLNNKWYCTKALYTSCHDLISKMLQFDVDGDSSLVVADQDLIEIAARNMKDVMPLYYEMNTAKPKILNNDNIWESIKSSWKYGNIGKYSNKLTKLWNNPEPDLDIAKIICFLNNSSIDAAKTNFMPIVKDKDIRKKIHNIEKLQLPYFFQFCKDYDDSEVAPIGNSTMDRICAKFESIDKDEDGSDKKNKYKFNADIGKFSYKTLMSDKDIKKSGIYAKYGELIIKKYKFLNEQKNYYFKKVEQANKHEAEEDISTNNIIWKHCLDELTGISEEINVIDLTDILVSHVFTTCKSQKKTLLFTLFGEIILDNINENIAKPLDEDYIKCKCCGKSVKKTSNRQKMCPACSEKAKEERNRNRKK